MRYPVALPYLQCAERQCGTWQLVDVELQSGPSAAGGFRLRYGNTAIAGFTWAHDRRIASLDTARLTARVEERDDGSVDVGATVRGSRWRFLARAERASDVDGGIWSVGAGASVQVSDEVEVEAGWQQAVDDQQPAFRVERRQRLARLGMRWQHGARLELGAAVRSERVIDGLGEGADRWGIEATAEWLGAWLAMAGAVDYSDTGGRFADQRLALGLQMDARIAGYGLLQLAASESGSLGVAEAARSWGAGLSFFGRRYRFARGDRAAAAAIDLADAAIRAGYDEQPEFDADAQRAQRERLSLSGRRESLRGAIDALYEAQVADRNVEQMAVFFHESRDLELGSRIRTLGGRVGIPWPLAWPWSRGEDRVEFIRLYGSYTVARFTEEAHEFGRELGAIVWLNRETFARIAWESPYRTPLDLALGKLGDDWVVATLSWRLGS